MKNEVTSYNTKTMLSHSLKKFMEKKMFSKITVSEIVADCGVNRKTFYYHFEDTQSLLKWTLEQEAFEVVKGFDLLINYEQAILFVLDYIEKNKHILNCAYDSIGRDELKRFLNDDFIGIIMPMITEIEQSMNVSCDEDFKMFLSSFYAEGLSGKIVEILKSREPYDRNTLVEYVSVIFRALIPEAIKIMDEKKKNL